MQYLSEKITDYIIKAGAISKESYAIYQYGFQIGLEMLSCFLVCFGISIYLHMIPQFLVFTSVFMLLRTYAGGLHLNSYFGCFICSTIIQISILLIDAQYTIILPISWGIILSSTALILINAPVENINRILDEGEKRHCKKITLRILLGVIIFSYYCTIAGINKVVSLIALTVFVVLVSQYIGIMKYNIEKKGRR